VAPNSVAPRQIIGKRRQFFSLEVEFFFPQLSRIAPRGAVSAIISAFRQNFR
jgi:hypothetical protein